MCAVGEILAPLPRAATQNLIHRAMMVVSEDVACNGVGFSHAVGDHRYNEALALKKQIREKLTPAKVKEVRSFIRRSLKETPEAVAALG